MTDLPPYTYIPGKTPHPISDPRGHSYQVESEESLTLEEEFQNGSRLFNHGYYWEAHEAWEAVWIKLGRSGPTADFVKSLIKFAACGVKCLEGNEVGAQRHLTRAIELIDSIRDCEDRVQTFDMATEKLVKMLNDISENLPIQHPDVAVSQPQVRPIFAPLPMKQ